MEYHDMVITHYRGYSVCISTPPRRPRPPAYADKPVMSADCV